MQDYRKLHVWQKAHQLAIRTYESAGVFENARSVAIA
jgi:hypothetical protein